MNLNFIALEEAEKIKTEEQKAEEQRLAKIVKQIKDKVLALPKGLKGHFSCGVKSTKAAFLSFKTPFLKIFFPKTEPLHLVI